MSQTGIRNDRPHVTARLPVASCAPVALAPMAGITDLPFREVVARFGAGMVVSEMVASKDMVNARPSARAKAELGFDSKIPTAVQLAGHDAYWMGEAARMVEAQGAQLIDINMGCPAKKVVGGLSGSALMRKLDHALGLIEAVVMAVDIPVTLKSRLGWDHDTVNAPELARRASEAGVQMVTIHGRTRCQFYKGQADWAAIGRVVEACPQPVLANGDITSVARARSALALSGAAGVMVGRGAQGRPWLLAQITAEIFGGPPAAPPPTGSALVDLVATHFEAALAFYGRELGLKTMRKHLGWYCDAAGASRSARHALLIAPTPAQVLSCLPDALASSAVRALEHAA